METGWKCSYLQWIFILITGFVTSERCPPLFGEIECPLKFKCEFNVCKNEQGLPPPLDCNQITCGPDARCFMGSCFPAEGLPCGRNVLVAENTARSVTSYCGRRGKCINGRCAIDKCAEVLCNDNELCRDGKCVRMADAFCFSAFDCGPSSGMECRGNRCVRDISVPTVSEGLSKVDCNPGEIFLGQNCVKQRGCEEIFCEPKYSCMNGVCLPMSGSDCSSTGCKFFVWNVLDIFCFMSGWPGSICVEDPCHNRCPGDHACLNGSCRPIQGMFCHNDDECSEPYACLNGQCVRNECARKVCQLGERCENGICIRIEGNLCTNPVRDCGEAFDCNKSTCRDKIHPINGSPSPDSSA